MPFSRLYENLYTQILQSPEGKAFIAKWSKRPAEIKVLTPEVTIGWENEAVIVVRILFEGEPRNLLNIGYPRLLNILNGTRQRPTYINVFDATFSSVDVMALFDQATKNNGIPVHGLINRTTVLNGTTAGHNRFTDFITRHIVPLSRADNAKITLQILEETYEIINGCSKLQEQLFRHESDHVIHALNAFNHLEDDVIRDAVNLYLVGRVLDA